MELKFSEELKKARVAKKITIREISDYVKKSMGYISDIEHERKDPPDLETVRKIEEFLGIKNGILVMVAANARKKMPSNLSQRLKARPLLSEVLLRADNLSDEEIKELLSKIGEREDK